MSYTDHGRCSVCGKVRRLTKSGVLWHHAAPKKFPPERCSGAGKPPSEVS